MEGMGWTDAGHEAGGGGAPRPCKHLTCPPARARTHLFGAIFETAAVIWEVSPMTMHTYVCSTGTGGGAAGESHQRAMHGVPRKPRHRLRYLEPKESSHGREAPWP